MSETVLVVHADAKLLAEAVAARLTVRLLDAQAERGSASVVLTGGRIAADDLVEGPGGRHVDEWLRHRILRSGRQLRAGRSVASLPPLRVWS